MSHNVTLSVCLLQRWLGAFNSTHADEVPACDGPVDAGKWYSDWCATQVTVNGARGPSTCTSCKPEYAFVMRNGASRTGRCEKYKIAPAVDCADPNSDGSLDPSATNGGICTKYLEAQHVLKVDSMQDEGAKAHYASVMGGHWGMAVPKCQVRKEVRAPH